MQGFSLYRKIPAISVSILTAFSRCPRKFFYSFGVSLSKEEHIALKFGEAIHAALPSAYFGDLETAMQNFHKVWGVDRPCDEKRNPENALLILDDYMMSHSKGRSIYKIVEPPGGVLRLSEKVSDYEIPFALDIGLPIPLIGRVDCLAQHRDTGDYWVLEWKTSSEMSTRFFEGFTFNPQVCAYTLALRSYGVPVKGAIVEGLKVSSAKKDAQETLSQPVFCSDSQIEDFIIWAKYRGLQILECEESQQFPKDLSACAPYSQFGMPGYQCEYLPMCLTKDWTILREMYQHKEYPTFSIFAEQLGLQKPTIEGKQLNDPIVSGPSGGESRDRTKDPSRVIRIGQTANYPRALSESGVSNPNTSSLNP